MFNMTGRFVVCSAYLTDLFAPRLAVEVKSICNLCIRRYLLPISNSIITHLSQSSSGIAAADGKLELSRRESIILPMAERSTRSSSSSNPFVHVVLIYYTTTARAGAV